MTDRVTVGSGAGDMNRAPLTEESLTPRLWEVGRRRLLSGLVLTVTLVGFEGLAISTVMPAVVRDLGGLDLYGWVFSGFFLGNLLGIVLAGQAADRHGAAAPLALGLALLAVGLLVGGLAPIMPVLVAGRILQGIGAGAIPAILYTAVGRAIPPLLRPRMFAVFSSAWVIPGLIGPILATAMTAAAGWRSVFLGLLPLVVLAAAMTVPALDHEPGAPAGDDMARGPLALALVAGVTLLLLAGSGVSAGWVIVCGGMGLPVAVAAFLRLVPPGTVRLAHGMPAAVMVRGLLTFSFFAADAYVSLTFTQVRDQPMWVGGLAMTAATLLWTSGSWVQQRWVHELGPRRMVQLGFAAVAVGIAGLMGGLRALPVAVSAGIWAIAGLGMGLGYAPLSVTVLATAPKGREGMASASLQLTDVLGVALGTGISGICLATAEAQGHGAGFGLTRAFAMAGMVAVAGLIATRRLPAHLPR